MIRIFDPSSVKSPIRWSWISLVGPDASDFLHRLTTVNVKALEPGQGAPGCWLNAQGKIRASFWLWNYRATEYAFELDAGADDHAKTELLALIDQYTFAEKITVRDVSGSPDPENKVEARWLFPEPGADLSALGGVAPGASLALDAEIRVCHHGDRDFGRAWLTVWGRPARLAQWAERTLGETAPVDFETVNRWRIAAARPWVGSEINDSANPLELGMVDAIAPNKGCYPGQEVIERIAALGSPARRLARIDGAGPPPTRGEKLLNSAEPPAEVGEITSSATTEAGFQALALLRKIHAKEALEVRTERGAHGTVAQVAPYA